jgi:hypothetical protein
VSTTSAHFNYGYRGPTSWAGKMRYVNSAIRRSKSLARDQLRQGTAGALEARAWNLLYVAECQEEKRRLVRFSKENER